MCHRLLIISVVKWEKFEYPGTLGAHFTLTLIPTWNSNYILYKVWDEIAYPFPNFNDTTIEV